MSLSIVSTSLNQFAVASAIKASRANDPDSIAALKAAEARFLRLSALLEADMAELASFRGIAARKAAAKRAPVKIGALEFWRRHGVAVQNIIAVYGLGWKVKAPFGETEIATIPNGWRSCKTAQGTVLKWSMDARVPAAAYWQDGRLPAGLVVSPDYPRDTNAVQTALRRERAALRGALRRRREFLGPDDDGCWKAYWTEQTTANVTRLRALRQALRAAGTTPWAANATTAHDAAWHRAHGYVRDGSGEWVPEVLVRLSQTQNEQIEEDRARHAEAERIEDNKRATLVAVSFEVQSLLMQRQLAAMQWADAI